ncbi:MAG: aldo/keto reductase [Coriobacteriales bacterium]
MDYRKLGSTGLEVSEIGFGAEWLSGKTTEQSVELVTHVARQGVNLVDCWMADPVVRRNLAAGVCLDRAHWTVQGHFGSTWQDGQYVRTRDMDEVVPSWEFLLDCFGGHIELGMVHYVDRLDELESIVAGPFLAYVKAERAAGHIDHVGISTHAPQVAQAAAESGEFEVIMFSVNPAFDLMPAGVELEELFDESSYRAGLDGIDDARARLYATCEERDVGITVMKPFAGGRLLDARRSPFGIALSPAQCLHYALTRPAVASVLPGFGTVAEADGCLSYETATDVERDYASALAGAPRNSYRGACTYCGHCQPCTAGIDIATVNKFADLAAMHDGVPASTREHYRSLDRHASDCTGCRACEPNCPFGVRIADKMTRTAELFGF